MEKTPSPDEIRNMSRVESAAYSQADEKEAVLARRKQVLDMVLGWLRPLMPPIKLKKSRQVLPVRWELDLSNDNLERGRILLLPDTPPQFCYVMVDGHIAELDVSQWGRGIGIPSDDKWFSFKFLEIRFDNPFVDGPCPARGFTEKGREMMEQFAQRVHAGAIKSLPKATIHPPLLP